MTAITGIDHNNDNCKGNDRYDKNNGSDNNEDVAHDEDGRLRR